MYAVTHSVKSSLLVAFRYLLKPLVRMAVKNGVSYPEFSIALKQAYVDVATRQIKVAGNAVTSEGIFVITNIDTAEVERTARAAASLTVDLDPQAQSPLPRLLAAWHTDPRFTGPYGVTHDLEYVPLPTIGRFVRREGPTFTELAVTYCHGISPKVLLDELVRTLCVKSVGNGFYRALSRSYVPDPLSDESIRLVAQVVHNLCETLEVNLRQESAGGKGLVQRTVYTRNGVSAKKMEMFQSFVRVRGQRFADEIDDWLTSNQEDAPTQLTLKTGVGFYHYVANDEDELDFSRELPIEGDGT